MPSVPVPADPGWDDDLAWLDRDPMTPVELEAQLLAGFELPPDEALAADQRITWWAGELKKAGLEGDMDVLRARAFLDLVLSKDSRPGAEPTAKPSPGGFAGRATLTVPLATWLR